jgi:hypothetical protein
MRAMPSDRLVPEPPPSVLALRPSAALRDRAIERLSAAFAEGSLETEEFERRITVAHRSASSAEIEAVLADLPLASSQPELQTALVPAAQAPAGARTLSVFGSTRRSGRWAVPRRLTVKAVFGNVELDFRNAVLPAGPVELDVSAVFGNIEITVPPHLAVESNGSAILGNFDHVDRAPAQLAPDAPILRISGTSVFGNVEITMRLADEPVAPRALPARR